MKNKKTFRLLDYLINLSKNKKISINLGVGKNKYTYIVWYDKSQFDE